MSLIRSIVVILLLVVWLPAVNACALAEAFPQSFSDCCEENTAQTSDHSSCAECATLENGLSVSLHPVSVPTPSQREDAWLTKLLLLLSTRIAEELPLVESCSSPPERPLWQLIVCTALPVRGPSVA